jgi:hypothetical protein
VRASDLSMHLGWLRGCERGSPRGLSGWKM